MALREFADGKGRVWRVWATRPATTRVRQELIAGWLTFEPEAAAGAVRRRLTPIPDGWEAIDEIDLRRLCSDARLDPSAEHPGAPTRSS